MATASSSAIDGIGQGEIINLTDRRARASRRRQLDVLHSLGPDGVDRELSALASRVERATTTIPAQLPLPHLVMPAHHDVRTSDVLTPRLYANLAAAADRAPIDFAELLLVPGVGARTVRVAEVMDGANAASPTRRASRLRMAARTGIRFLCPFESTTRRSMC